MRYQTALYSELPFFKTRNVLHAFKNDGRSGGTRTPTPLLAAGPKPAASADFATDRKAELGASATRAAFARTNSVIVLLKFLMNKMCRDGQ